MTVYRKWIATFLLMASRGRTIRQQKESSFKYSLCFWIKSIFIKTRKRWLLFCLKKKKKHVLKLLIEAIVPQTPVTESITVKSGIDKHNKTTLFYDIQISWHADNYVFYLRSTQTVHAPPHAFICVYANPPPKKKHLKEKPIPPVKVQFIVL